MNRYCTKTTIGPALLPPHGGTMLVFYEAGKEVGYIEYIRRKDAESDEIRWMNGEDFLSIKKTAGGNADSSGSSTPSLTPKPTRPKPPSM